ncbi:MULTISPECIES: helix-turn-helix domain-containing protein [Novosphingobium]|jgi:transcriptional regulator with XRE-family HTH domain|uniref:XRE family transcriptional regulator n=1 Tax=Novosphingobium subterraneum TaxID=48936 RepID=A0A0B9A101_9SPHN|nr:MULTISPECIES: helix-turn-helix transcriptional regulator [Novosphingobium]KHS49026.1 XRE family transcriptional regulator [Novosphingobium subterraneum]QOV95121.1 helix-turn-helix transcriptional regulator [Novosphingobium sp. ES2-1]
MINRIRDIRRQKGMTLADVAARCDPPTTAQTIGRLETGTRSLSLTWMNRIGAALGVEPQLLVKAEEDTPTHLVARLGPNGAEALAKPMDAILPVALDGSARLLALAVEASAGEYRAGDQVWLRQIDPEDFARAFNRDVLAPRTAGRFAFGRLIDQRDGRVALLPPGPGQRQVVIDRPAWLGVAEMLVRKL